MRHATTNTHQTPARDDREDQADHLRDGRDDDPGTTVPLQPVLRRADPRRAHSAAASLSSPSTSLPSAADTVAELDRRKLAVTVEEAARLLSLNRTKIYALCMRGELRSFKVGRSRRIPMAGIYEYVERVSA